MAPEVDAPVQASAPMPRSGASPALVLPIDGVSGATAALGGKGAWLDELVAAGFPVPASVAITTEAYRAVAAQPELAALLRAFRGTDPVRERAATEQAEIDAAFLAVSLPDAVDRALEVAFASASASAGSDRVAVRSSATAEDMAGTSFAGQYRSFLDVDAAGFERAVRLVWASLWHPAPRWYRRFNGIGDEEIGMAVVVMPMVDAELSGVAFSIDPGGAEDSLRIELVHGLGEQLVSGAVTPGVHVVRRDDGDHPDPVVREVAALVLAIERAFGAPQDIEWAVIDGALFVLQARPITTRAHRDDGFETPALDGVTWTTAGVGEMLPGCLAPLVWQTNRRLLDEAFRELFGHLGNLPDDIDDLGGFVGRFRGQAVLNLDVMKAASGVADAEVERQYFGGKGADPTRAGRGARLAGWRRNLVLERVRRRGTVSAESTVEGVRDLVKRTPDLARLDTPSLHAYRNRLMDFAAVAMASEVSVASSASAAHRRLELALASRFDDAEASRHTLRLTAVTGSVDAAPIDPRRSMAVFAGPTWDERRRPLSGRAGEPDTPPAERSEPRGERPRKDQGDAWADLLADLRALPNWGATRALTGQVVDVRVLVLRRLVEDANDLLSLRERTKGALLRLGGEVRRVHLECGTRLAGLDLLEHPIDVDHLSERELLGLDPLPPRAEVARRRRWLESQDLDRVPVRFTGAPGHRAPTALTGDVVHGWGASGGRHTGRAVVLDRPDDAGLARGDVLVARCTDASWAPAFMQAGAIVVEEGGPLSHAAIVARELGLPAVVNLPGIVDRLAGSGTIVLTVDGDDGEVHLHESEGGST